MNFPGIPEEAVEGEPELVLYKADTEFADEEPTHEILKDLGLVSWNLWVSWPDAGFEFPIVGESSWYGYFSAKTDVYVPDDSETVSDEWILAMDEMLNFRAGGGLGGMTDETWAELTDFEKYLLSLLREDGFDEQIDPPEIGWLFDYCTTKARKIEAERDLGKE